MGVQGVHRVGLEEVFEYRGSLRHGIPMFGRGDRDQPKKLYTLTIGEFAPFEARTPRIGQVDHEALGGRVSHPGSPEVDQTAWM